MTNCTKCTVKPIVKEHMCDECYESHNVVAGVRSERLITTGEAKIKNNHSYVEVVCDCGID